MSRSGLRVALAAVCAGAAIGLLVATGSAVASPQNSSACAHKKVGAHRRAACAHKKPKPHKKPKHKKRGPHSKGSARPHKKASVGQGTCGVGDVSLGSWMGDLASCLSDRKLSEIVIPGSHDSDTYSLTTPFYLTPWAVTQRDDLTAQLNEGIREFDIRVENDGGDYEFYAHHGSGNTDVHSNWLYLTDILSDIQRWMQAPGHGKEIIILNVSISGGGDPSNACGSFGQNIGSDGLVTPSEVKAHFDTTDPGQVTLGQLWSLSDSTGEARVIMNNGPCLNDAATGASESAGEWSPYSSGYYADQCTANGRGSGDQSSGITKMVLGAVHRRATEAGSGEPYAWGPPAVGGLYELDIQGTPEADCLVTPGLMLPDENQVLAALYNQWLTDPATYLNLNVVAEDFVGWNSPDPQQFGDDVIAMNQARPIAIEGYFPNQSAEQNSSFDYRFYSSVSFHGQPATGLPVTYKISPFDGSNGPHFWEAGGSMAVITSKNGSVELPSQDTVVTGSDSGTWTLTATAPRAPAPVTWTLTVSKPPTRVITLQPASNPGTVQAGSTIDWPLFAVRALDQNGNPVNGGDQEVRVTFDATGVGTFGTEHGEQPTYTNSQGPDGVAYASTFTAGTRAGGLSISAYSPESASTVSLPITIAPGPLAAVTAESGDGQQTGENRPFAQQLVVRVTDAWHNPISGVPVTFSVTSGEATFASLNQRRTAARTGYPAVLHRADPPSGSVTVSTDDQGVATAPVLTAGPSAGPLVVTASGGVAPANEHAVFHLSAVKVAPSAPTITGLTNGDSRVGVAFSGATNGTAPITSYEVSAIDTLHPASPPVTATGPSSPVTVRGLTDGDPYVFGVTATSADGTSPPSAPTNPINVGVAPVVVSGPAKGTVGKPYSSGFTVTGAPAPTVTLISGDVPGLTPGSDGSLTGTPTQAGSYELTVQATNPVGIYSASVTVRVSAATLGAPAPVSRGRRVRATICTTRAGHKPACAVRTLTGTFPPLEASAAATLVRGTVTYAVGRASADYRELTLTRRRQVATGSYTLILRRPRRAIFVPVVYR